MTTVEFLSKLRSLDVRLWVAEDRLRCSAPDSVLTPELRAELAERKTEIMAFLRGARDAVQVASLPAIVPVPDDLYQPFPLTKVQQAYWIGRSGDFELGNVATHLYLEFDHVDLDLGRVEWAWQRLIERHPMLRAIIRPDGQQQVLEQVPPYRIEVVDLRGQERDVVAAGLEGVRQELSHQVLPSDRWPLFEIRATRLDDRTTRLHISLDLLIGDAWSWQVLSRELDQLYYDLETSSAPLELSFRDYVLAEGALRESEQYQRSLDYWRSRLPALPPAPELPLAKGPGSLARHRFVRREARLEPERWRRLKAGATQAGLTPSGVLLAAYAEVLTVWSKSPRLTINLTLFNRLPLHPQVNEIVGDFTSLILLAVDNSGPDTFESRARRLQEQLWKDLDHRYVSGVHVMRELAQMQGGAQGAAMPVVFTSTLTHTPDQEALTALDVGTPGREGPGLISLGDEVYGISQTPQVWLDHQVAERGGELLFNWDAVEELFPDGLLDDMFDAYCRLLERLADEEGAWSETTGRLVPVPPAQLEQRAAINATEAPLSDELLPTLFAAQVSERPDQPAVITSSRTLTYEELYRRSNQIGHWLREKGAQPNRLVAVLMEKGWEQVVAVLGILQAGAAYLPIAAELPQERVRYLLENGEVELLLTQSWLAERLAWPEGIQRLCVDDNGVLEGVDDEPLPPVQGQEDLAYVIYTSGSTGKPKGVMIDHRGAVNTILDINQRFRVGPQDRVLALSRLGFDLSVYDIFGLLAAGGTIVIPDAAARRDPAHWAELMVREQVTIWDSVPALMEMLVEYVEGRFERLPDSLRVVFMSGDWIPVTLPDRIKALAEGVEVWSGGGATEASIWSILYPIEKVDPAWPSIPYGKPMVNQSFHVLDDNLEPRPVWVPGQLYIGGIGLAKGYWRDGEKTDASFITHPRTGERLYRTGDLGRYLPDGDIEFLGREDFQVKIRGYRIELGEIEAALIQYPAVRAGVVMAVGEPRGDKWLVAYVVPDRDSTSPLGQRRGVSDEQPLVDYERPQGERVLLDPLERLRFKLTHPGLREKNGRPCVQLVQPELDETLIEAYLARRSYRRFDLQTIPFERFSQFLSCLRQVELEGSPLPKYRYGSAGSLYPVQAYLYVKPKRVESLAGGTYYYHPQEHQLVLLSSDAHIDPGLYPPGNREIFEASAFVLFLVGQLEAITPLYGEWARDFCLLEAGLMTQLLEMSASVQQVGLCQIGAFDFEPIRPWFALEEGHVYLHSLVGGRIEASQATLQALVDDSSELRFLLELLQQGDEKGDGSVCGQLVPSLTSVRIPEAEPDSVFVEELRGFLSEKLPEYMVPSVFMMLEELPLTANGKVDRRALPVPDTARAQQRETFVLPQSEVERAIAAVWQEVLGVDQVGIHDNFFELGGNSIMGIQVLATLRETGFQISPAQLFQNQTIAELASVLQPTLDAQSEEVLSLTPRQERLLAQDVHEPHVVVLELEQRLDSAMLEQAIGLVCSHHDALGLRFTREGDSYRQVFEVRPSVSTVTTVDLTTSLADELDEAIAAEIMRLKQGFGAVESPLLRAVHLQLGAGHSDRLLLAVTPLSADAAALPILLEDLHTAYRQVAQATEEGLPRPTVTFADWVKRVTGYAQSDALNEQQAYWRRVASQKVYPLPTDSGRTAVATGTTRGVTARLTVEQTQRLHELPGVYRIQPEEIILAGLTQVLTRWSGHNGLLVGFSHYQRGPVFTDLDTSRVVGCLRAEYPLYLDVPIMEDLDVFLKAVKEQVRQVPQQGLGYGFLCVTDETLAVHPPIAFSYCPPLLGDALFRIADVHLHDDPTDEHIHLSAGTIDGQLQLTWRYNTGLHREATIVRLNEELVSALQTLTRYCYEANTVMLTPSDFPESSLGQEALDRLIAKIGGKKR